MALAKKTISPNITGDLQQINYSLDDFKRIREDGFLYVDKTKMIEDILTYDKGKAILFTRPRRFGKSMNLSMLRYFFDMAETTGALFKGLYIEQSPFFQTHLNQYPVLYLNFKDILVNTPRDVEAGILRSLKATLQELYEAYQWEELRSISLETAAGNLEPLGLKDVTRILSKKAKRRAIVLVDEYDGVINQAYGTDAWKDAAVIIKRLFGALLKSNEYLEMGIMTGVSRIGRELGFSDMNNLAVYGLTKKRHYESFGFTEEEVRELLKQNQIEMSSMFYRMYDGYHFEGTSSMFNPTSILKCLSDFQDTGREVLAPYWINSATNRILKDNIARQGKYFKDKLLRLLDGGSITEVVFESIDYEILDQPAHLFSLLIDTGYLCPIRRAGGDAFELRIPNEEVLYGYREMIGLITGTDGQILASLCASLIEADIEQFDKKFDEILRGVASYHDFSEKENSYHNLVMGALLHLLGRFRVYSNRESGLGRYDIAIIPNECCKARHRPMIIEFKAVRDNREYSDDELLALAKEALGQIEHRQYAAGYAPAYQKEDFLRIGIGAQGKRCRVVAKRP